MELMSITLNCKEVKLEIHWLINAWSPKLWSLPVFSINERQETLWDGLHQSLDHQPLDSSHSPAWGFLFPLDPFLLSVIPRVLNTCMLRSANWNIMISLIWVRSNDADVSWFTWLSLIFTSSHRFINVNSTPFVLIPLRVVCKLK